MDPWDKQGNESDADFALFRAYQLQVPPRRLDLVAARAARTTASISSLATRRRWVSRAAAYDAHLYAQARDRIDAEVEEIRRLHLVALRTMRERGMELLQQDGGSVADGQRMLAESIKLERLAIGEVTDRQQLVQSRDPAADLDLSLLTDDEADEFQRLLHKAMGRIT